MEREELLAKGPAHTVSDHFNIHYGIALGLCRAFYKKLPWNRVSCDNWTDQEILEFNEFIKDQLGARVN